MALQTNKYGQQESFIPSRPHESTVNSTLWISLIKIFLELFAILELFASRFNKLLFSRFSYCFGPPFDCHHRRSKNPVVHNPAAKRRGDAGCPRTSLRPRAGLTPTPRIHTFLELTTVPRFLKNARPEAGDTVQLSRHAEPSTRRFRTPQALHAVSDHLVAFTGAVNSLYRTLGYLSPRTVAHELASLVRDILEIPSVHTVIVGEPIWRLRLPPYMRDFHARVREFSQTLRPLIDSIPNTTTWRHCKLWQKNPDYFVADGLHLSDFGNLRYYKSIRYAILPHLPAR
ncbi:hypothetical protein Bbelb_399430 [Branchiostoma belcheri]|nr:hypothetical protein Bbelb_399430 [Branchiostoma belcheri]